MTYKASLLVGFVANMAYATLLSTAPNLPLAPAAKNPPHCFSCNKPSQRMVTRSSNRNANGGRPYYKCISCGYFFAFADERGNNPDNPSCDCGESSRLQRAGENSSNPGGLHYVCRLGTCDYYEVKVDENQEQVTTSLDLVDHFAGLNII